MTVKEKIRLTDAIPCRGEQVTTKWEGETMVLSFPRFKRRWMQCLLLPKGMSKEIRIELEEHGSAVWKLVDGRRSVGEIIEELADHFGHKAGYESRISAYLSQLHRDGLIKLCVGHSSSET